MIVISLVMPIILCFGVLAAYAAVFAILSTFGRHTQPEPARAHLVLVPTQNHASGD